MPDAELLTLLAPATRPAGREAWTLWQQLRHSSSAHAGRLWERDDSSHVLLAFRSPRHAIRFALSAVGRETDVDPRAGPRVALDVATTSVRDRASAFPIGHVLDRADPASLVLSDPAVDRVKGFLPADTQLRPLDPFGETAYRWYALDRPQLPLAFLSERTVQELQYLRILRKAIEAGTDRRDRTGVGTRAIFGETMRFRMRDGFPAVTTKRLAFRSVLAELLWFIAGSSDVTELHALGVHIWDGNAYADYWRPRARFPGDAGRNYGQQWRDWIGPDGTRYDQLAEVVRAIRTHPSSRRHVVTAWNPAELQLTSLPACHAMFQFFVSGGSLSLAMYQRSADLFLGVPFNIAQYALLLHLAAQMAGLVPNELVHVLGDAHVYRTHIQAARLQLMREPYPSPTLWLDPSLRSLDDVVARYRDVVRRAREGERPGDLLDGIARLEDHRFHPAIKAEMAV